jgi:arginine decarboxylase
LNAPSSTEGDGGTKRHGVDITVRAAAGSGRTTLSAFDHALLGAGVGNFNLLLLSSVIPPASRVRVLDGREHPLAGEHGDRLYCVLSAAYAVEPGQQVWAGLGWVVDEESGRGLFVEHSAATEDELRLLISDSLGDLVDHRGGGYGEVQQVLASATYDDRPACALAVAAYEVAGWAGRG